MDFIEINDSADYENIGYVNENGVFEKTSAADDDNIIVSNPPHNLVDNQSFYRDFAKKNPQQHQQQRQQFPRPILKQNNAPQQPQKKVTYDDILSSLKMKVTDGKLQFMRTDDAAIESINMPKEEPIHNKGNRKIVSFNEQPPNFYVSPPPQIKMAPKTLKTRHLPIPQEYQEDVIQRPLTRQEAIIKLLQAREEAARIRQIKSTKLQFSTQNIKVHPTIAPQMSNMFFKFM